MDKNRAISWSISAIDEYLQGKSNHYPGPVIIYPIKNGVTQVTQGPQGKTSGCTVMEGEFVRSNLKVKEEGAVSENVYIIHEFSKKIVWVTDSSVEAAEMCSAAARRGIRYRCKSVPLFL